MPSPLEYLAQALQPGLQSWAQRHYEEDQQRKVARALAATYGQPNAQPGPAPGPAPLAAMGQPPVPHPAPQPAPFRPGVPPQQGQPDPLAPLPSQPPPGAPTGEAGAEAPTGVAVAPGLEDPIKEGQSLIKNLWQTISARNPKADPLTIMRAVQNQIDDIKGIAPMTKAVMQGQLQYLNYTMKGRQFDERESRLMQEHAEKMAELARHHANQDAVAQENARFRGEMAQAAIERANSYGENVEYTHQDRQSAEEGRNTRFEQGDQTKRDISDQRSDDSEYRADQSFRGSQVRGGQTPDPAPQRPARRAGPSVPPDVAEYAKSKGLTVVGRQKDGWVVKDKAGKTYHLRAS